MIYLWAILAYIGALVLCASAALLWLLLVADSVKAIKEDPYGYEAFSDAWDAFVMAIVKALHIDKATEAINNWLVGLCHKGKV